jgi:hypothetical protein
MDKLLPQLIIRVQEQQVRPVGPEGFEGDPAECHVGDNGEADHGVS